ncbi:cupin domain-containing protein [Nocardia sp. alder85J]|uniref:cupin domain-containing protein n=1 Tax=Nocardia sp. alder85J TaxID=2862949 RepID=UPI001CD36DA8|nr:hypothetical protein [Nocardia sp. alder85J]MCX4095599.1 hypothetical protein [Nocardia sp. alder85J]
MSDTVASQRALDEARRVVYFALGEAEGWRQSKPSRGPAERMPESIRLSGVDVDEYFRDGLFSKRMQIGSFHLLEVRFAPGFVIPRHHHNFDQMVVVVEGSVRQGRRWFQVGDGYFTKADTPYVTAAGPEGARIVEVRKDPIEELEVWWDEAKPERWQRERWHAAAASADSTTAGDLRSPRQR